MAQKTRDEEARRRYHDSKLKDAFERGRRARLESKAPPGIIEISSDEWSKAWREGYHSAEGVMAGD